MRLITTKSKLIEMQNKLESLGAATNRMINELANLKDLSVGTLELVKRLPDYEKALDVLKDNYKKKEENESIQGEDTV
jgi:predicted ATP-grasp superfamily ATP-dependent carboligase